MLACRASNLCFVALLALARIVTARDKTDILVMRNGDRITCEVKKLESGILEIGVDYVDGNLAVDWMKVARLESEYVFVFRLEDGST